ncbi:RsiV family protein [Parapedobacter sp.]
MTKLTACVLFFSFALSACQLNTGETERANDTVVVDTLAYVYEDYIKYSKNLIKTSETTDTTFFAASYPVFDDSSANRFVRTALLGNDTTTVEEAATTFIGEFDRFQAYDPYPRVWTSESHAKVFGNTPTYLALAIHASSYTGGAHGNYATVFKHYDLQTGKSLELDDIVSQSYQNELTAVAERYFRDQENLGVDQPLDNGYFFNQGQFNLPDNFALEPDSMLFLYNIYEIKPYVNGQTELRIPYRDIERLLTDRAKRIINELNIQVEP